MTDFTGVAGDDIGRAVSRAVINNNKFQAVQILFLYAVKKSAQEILAIIDGDNEDSFIVQSVRSM